MRIPVYIRGEGYGFGLGFGVLTNSAEAQDALSIGSYTWGGAYGTLYWAEIVFRIGSRRSWGDQLRTSRLLKKSVERDRQIDPGVLPCSQYC